MDWDFRFVDYFEIGNPGDWFLLVPIGVFERFGRAVEVRADDIAEMVANFGKYPPTPLPINREHDHPAGKVGDVAEVQARSDGLWARFDWFDSGRKLLDERAFQFFSPEIVWGPTNFDGNDNICNVLMAVALTNSPYFGESTAVFSFKGDAMQYYFVEEHDLFRQFSEEERRQLAKEGKALPDGSFPIVTVQDLRNAMQAIGRGGSPRTQIVRHIEKRARALIREGALSQEAWDTMREESKIFGGSLEDDGMTVEQNTLKAALAEIFAPLLGRGGGDGKPDSAAEAYAALASTRQELATAQAEVERLTLETEAVTKAANLAASAEKYSVEFREIEALNASDLPGLLAEVEQYVPETASKLAEVFRALAAQADPALFGEHGSDRGGAPDSAPHELYWLEVEKYAAENKMEISAAMNAVAAAQPDLAEAYSAYSRRKSGKKE